MSVINALVNLAKSVYDNYPGVVKNSGLLELSSLPIYRKIYSRQIAKKMSDFQKGEIAVEFEVTNKCNADCIMCPNSLMQRVGSYMPMELFKSIADEFAQAKLPLVKFVFAGIGEPTLDPLLPEKIFYLKQKMPQIPVQLTTNASLLTPERAQKLIEAGLDRVIISFNGTTKESYEKVMGHLKYEKTLANLLHFLSLRQNNKPHVTLSCVRLDDNAQDFAQMRKFWLQKGVHVDAIKTPVPFNRGGDQMSSRYTSKWALEKPKAQQMLPCRMMAENLLIHPNGSVVLCFVDYEEKLVMGQFGKDSLQKILQTKYDWFVKHQQGDFSHTPLCQNCTFMKEQVISWWKGSYF